MKKNFFLNICSVWLFFGFFFLTVIKIDAPCSVLPFPIACHPPALLARSRRVGLKIWVCRKYLSVLCNSPCSSPVSGALHAESLCWVSAFGGGGGALRVTPAPEEDLTQGDKTSQSETTATAAFFCSNNIIAWRKKTQHTKHKHRH